MKLFVVRISDRASRGEYEDISGRSRNGMVPVIE